MVVIALPRYCWCVKFKNKFWDKLSVQVLVRLVGADDHVYPNFIDVMKWLAESNLLDMIVDKLTPSVSEALWFAVFPPPQFLISYMVHMS